MHMQVTGIFSPGGVLGTAVGRGFQSNCSPSPLCLRAEVGAGLGLPPESLPVATLAPEEAALSTALASCRQAPLEGSARGAPIPRACPQPLLVPASPSQLCKPSLGIWFVKLLAMPSPKMSWHAEIYENQRPETCVFVCLHVPTFPMAQKCVPVKAACVLFI